MLQHSSLPWIQTDTIGVDETEESLFVDEVERVNQFNFLGTLITQEGGCNREIRRRLAMARTTLARLTKIWTDLDN